MAVCQQTTIRLPQELNKQLRWKAAERGYNLKTLIIIILQEYLQQDGLLDLDNLQHIEQRHTLFL